jgi:predicted  nucleic acid-binding Zn-ribbon protein
MNSNLEDMKAKFLELSVELATLKEESKNSFKEWKKAEEALRVAQSNEFNAQSIHSRINTQRLEVAQQHHALAWQISDLVSDMPKELRYEQS